MIQRIQSFWLVLAACCMALCFMTPLAEYQMETTATGQSVEAEFNLIAKDNPEMMNQMLNMEPVIGYSQKVSGFHTWPLVLLAIASGVIALVGIFLYRNRVVQMRVVAVGFLLNVILVFLLFFWAVDSYANIISQAMGGGELQTKWLAGAYSPIVSIIFFVLAHRGIKRDEAKVRAADRLR